MNRWPWVFLCIAWMATGIAVAVGIYITKDARCLWAMLAPTLISWSSNGASSG